MFQPHKCHEIDFSHLGASAAHRPPYHLSLHPFLSLPLSLFSSLGRGWSPEDLGGPLMASTSHRQPFPPPLSSFLSFLLTLFSPIFQIECLNRNGRPPVWFGISQTNWFRKVRRTLYHTVRCYDQVNYKLETMGINRKKGLELTCG